MHCCARIFYIFFFFDAQASSVVHNVSFAIFLSRDILIVCA